jgi:hypothetical protein
MVVPFISRVLHLVMCKLLILSTKYSTTRISAASVFRSTDASTTAPGVPSNRSVSFNDSTLAQESTVRSVHGSNVLALHRAKSGTAHNIPTVQQLTPHAQILNQSLSPVSLNRTAQSEVSSSSNSQTSNQVQSKHTHKSRRRSSHFQSPAKLGFYSPRSKTILRDAKMKYRIFIATQCAFPTTAQALESAVVKYSLSGEEYAAETESDREDIPIADTGRLQVVSGFASMCYSGTMI